MDVFIFCSSKMLGSDGTKEISTDKIKGQLFAKKHGVVFGFFFERRGFDNLKNGFYNMVDYLYKQNGSIIWINSLSSWCLDWGDMQFLLDLIHDNAHHLYIGETEFYPINKSLIKHISILINNPNKTPNTSPQQAGRNNNINAGMNLKKGMFGYNFEKDSNGKYLVRINKSEATIIKLIFYLYTVSNKSISKISKSFPQARTKTGKSFSKQKIKEILNRPEYSGRSYNSTHTRLIPSIYYFKNSIISSEQSDIARKKLANESKPNRAPQIRSFYSGLIRCGICNEPYYLRKPDTLFHRNNSYSCKSNPKTIAIQNIKDFLIIVWLEYCSRSCTFYALEENYNQLLTKVLKAPLLTGYSEFELRERRQLIKVMENDKRSYSIINKQIATVTNMKRRNDKVNSLQPFLNKVSKSYALTILNKLDDDARKLISGRSVELKLKYELKSTIKSITISNYTIYFKIFDGTELSFPLTERYKEECIELRVLHYFRTGKPSHYDLMRHSLY